MKNIRNCEMIKSYLPTSVAEPVGADYAWPRDGDEILTRLRLYVNKKFTVEHEPKYLRKLKSLKGPLNRSFYTRSRIRPRGPSENSL